MVSRPVSVAATTWIAAGLVAFAVFLDPGVLPLLLLSRPSAAASTKRPLPLPGSW